MDIHEAGSKAIMQRILFFVAEDYIARELYIRGFKTPNIASKNVSRFVHRRIEKDGLSAKKTIHNDKALERLLSFADINISPDNYRGRLKGRLKREIRLLKAIKGNKL